MAQVCKVETERDVKSKPHKFYELIKYSLHHLPTIFPEVYKDAKILEGDGASEGSIRQWKYVIPGTTEERFVNARTTKQDDENMTISMYIEEGSLRSDYKHFVVIVQVSPKGDGSAVKWIAEFEKHHDEIPDPNHYLDIFNGLIESVDDHLQKTEVCKVETERDVKSNARKFYEAIKYSLHHLHAIFPEVYKDAKILIGDGANEGSVRQWKYIIPGTTEERYANGKTTKVDDENMIMEWNIEEGNLRGEYKHFGVIVQVTPKGERSTVKWTVEFEKEHDAILDPHHYMDIFNGLIESVDAHLQKTQVCKVETERDVKSKPHKFYEAIKYSLHHLHTIFPEVYKDAKLLKGDGASEGSVRQWKYVIPGTTEERYANGKTTKNDDENMISEWYIEDGNLRSDYKHFVLIVQVTPKGKGSTVKWTVEFEKQHDEIPDPHHYMDIFNALIESVDAHLQKA